MVYQNSKTRRRDYPMKKKKLKESNDKSKNTYERTFNTQAFDSVVSNMSKNARL